MKEESVLVTGALVGFTVGAIYAMRFQKQDSFMPVFITASCGFFVGAVTTKFYVDYKRRKF